MQIEKLLEKQEKEFVKKYNSSVLLAYPEYAESHMILLTDIWNWHKQSLKQFIDGLVEREEVNNKQLTEEEYNELGIFFNLTSEVDRANKVRKQDFESRISHLKEIRKQLE